MVSVTRKSSYNEKQLNRLFKEKRYHDVIKKVSKAIALTPGDHYLWDMICQSYIKLDEKDQALQLMLKRTRNFPKSAEAFASLGDFYVSISSFKEAENSYLKAVINSKNPADVWCKLADLYKKQNRLTHVETCYLKALELDSCHIHASISLGMIYVNKQSYHPAIVLFRNVLDKKGSGVNKASVLNAIAVCYQETKQFDKAIEFYDKAIDISPSESEVYSNKGKVLLLLDRLMDAVICMEKAAFLGSADPKLFRNLGWAYMHQSLWVDALNSFRKAVELSRGDLKYKSLYQAALSELGCFELADELIPQEVQSTIRSKSILENQVAHFAYRPYIASADLFELYKRYADACFSDIVQMKQSLRSSVSGRKIRIGYISPDFKSHVCRYFYEALFLNCNKEKFEIFAYSNVKSPDRITKDLKGYFDGWVDIFGQSDKNVAKKIDEDKIDILIDLAGHTMDNRVAVLAYKPAPIQITYLGYGYTTGMSQIDFFVGDENVTPVGCEEYFSESILRLDGPGYCYTPPLDRIPEVSDLPALKNGFITFGSLSRMIRFNDRVLNAWAEILRRIPSSRLILDLKVFSDDKAVKWFSDRLDRFNISRDRVILRCTENHWDSFKDIDISLDAFPHNAGTTLWESLIMGVPVISKEDRPSVGRLCSCILKPLGLNDWIADTEESYIEKAVELSSDLCKLAELRAELRPRMFSSDLMDTKKFAARFESKLLEVAVERIG